DQRCDPGSTPQPETRVPGRDHPEARARVLLPGDGGHHRSHGEDRQVPPVHGTTTSPGSASPEGIRPMRFSEEMETLMNQEVDGANRPEESARLRELLASAPHAREEMQSLREVSLSLSALPQREPPADLTTSIMRSLPSP